MKKLTRKEYVKEYHALGDAMFESCVIPTVADFANAFKDGDKEALAKIEKITTYTGNTDDIKKSVDRRNNNYSEAESKKFMQSVIAANVTDITESGYFYKKLISSCDDMTIDILSKILFIFGRGQAVSECLYAQDEMNYYDMG